ncbi:MAG: TolC family protein [Rhizobiales bacterium]|nr:TolC family protein [Hyphomicrobiales bacterium]
MSIFMTSCATQRPSLLPAVAVSDLPDLPKSLTVEDEVDEFAVKKINKKLFQTGHMEKMTLSFVAKKMLVTNPDIEIFNAREEQAKYGIDIARAKLWPTIDVKISEGRENVYTTSGDTLNSKRQEASIAVNHTLFDFGKIGKDIEQSEKAHEAAQLRAKGKADKILLTLANAYLDVLETRELSRVTNKNILQIHKFKNLVKANQEEGNASVADLKKVEARLENARAVFVDLKANYETSRENFKKITDFYPINLQQPPKLSYYEKANFADAQFNLMDTKIELQAIRKDIEGLTKKLGSIGASRLPVIRLAALANYKKNVGGLNDPIKDIRFDVSVKFRLFDGGAKAAQEKRVEAEIREGRALLRKKTKGFEQDMRNSDSDQKASIKKNTLLAKRLKAARKVVELNTEQFKEGVLTIFELLDAQTQLLSAHQAQIKNRFQKYRVRYKQLHLADRLLPSLVEEN